MARFRIPFPRRRQSNAPMGQGAYPRKTPFKKRLILALILAAVALISYYSQPKDVNQITGEEERVALATEDQEIQLGLQAMPQLVQQHGGRSPDEVHRQRVRNIGLRLLDALDAYAQSQGGSNPYRDAFDFTLLADRKVVNAFALPGGQVFITEALYRQLDTEGKVAGVLGHEIGHVVARHGNKQMAKQKLLQGLVGAGSVLGGDQQSAQMAQMVSAMIGMKYGREHELESDKWGVRLCTMAGYDPRAMIGVMEVLDEAAGGQAPPEFFSTHPKPANRVAYIKKIIREEFPNGVPDGLRP